MSSPDETRRTTGGLVGKVKEILGQAGDSDELKREGGVQQAQPETGLEAEEVARAPREHEARGAGQEREADERAQRDRLAAQVAAEQRETQIEQDRAAAEHRADARAINERVAADAHSAREHGGAERFVPAAGDALVAATQEANRLVREAHEAQPRADERDPTDAQT